VTVIFFIRSTITALDLD